jgi:hypothetical protein
VPSAKCLLLPLDAFRITPNSPEESADQPFGESAIAYHASADPQMHSWRDWKQTMAAA